MVLGFDERRRHEQVGLDLLGQRRRACVDVEQIEPQLAADSDAVVLVAQDLERVGRIEVEEVHRGRHQRPGRDAAEVAGQPAVAGGVESEPVGPHTMFLVLPLESHVWRSLRVTHAEILVEPVLLVVQDQRAGGVLQGDLAITIHEHRADIDAIHARRAGRQRQQEQSDRERELPHGLRDKRVG